MAKGKSGPASTITTVTSRTFNQDVAGAKRAALSGPVFITDRGKPTHVLLSMENYRRFSGQRRSLVDALSLPGLTDIEFDPHRARIRSHEADLA